MANTTTKGSGGQESPESLHTIQATKLAQANPNFVNPGTPSSPLVGRKDLADPTVSTAATEGLRNGLIK